MVGFGGKFTINDKLVVEVVIVTSDLLASKQDSHDDNQLIGSLANDVPPHNWGDNGFLLRVRWHIKELQVRIFSSKGQCCECVHKQVDPQHFNSVKRLSIRR